MAKMYFRQTLSGGTSDALDGIDGSLLVDGDGAVVITGEWSYIYHLDSDSGESQNFPNIVKPDTNAGNKRWKLMKFTESTPTMDQRRVFIQSNQPTDTESDIGDLWIDIT